ncbi:TauD/TfdA family dioxygenase [Pseudomonas lini]
MNTPAYHSESPDVSIIEPRHFASLGKAELYELLGHYGVVLLRNCIHNAEDFSAYVKQNSSRLSLDPARVMVGGAAQLVDAGRQAIGLHCENGNSPFWPDITWFYCQEAPRKGSQTTLCDGEKVLAKLSPACRTFFSRTTRFATAALLPATNGVGWSATIRRRSRTRRRSRSKI